MSSDAEISRRDPPAASGDDTQAQPSFQTFLEGFARMFLMFTLMQFASQTFFSGQRTGQPPPTEMSQQAQSTDPEQGGRRPIKPVGADPSSFSSLTVADRFAQGRAAASRQPPSCLWDPGTEMDLAVYFTDAKVFDPSENDKNSSPLLAEWHEAGLILGGGQIRGGEARKKGVSGNDRAANVTVGLTDAIRRNETHLYAHVRLTRKRRDGGDRNEPGELDVLSKTILMTRHKIRKRERDEKSLLGRDGAGGEAAKAMGAGMSSESLPDFEAEDPNDDSPLTTAGRNSTHDQILLYLKPSLTLQLVDISAVPQFPERRSIPPQFGEHMDWLSDDSSFYYPILYSSEFWITKSSLRVVNGTLPANAEATVEVRFEDASMWKWQLMSQMESSWRTQAEMLGEDESASDMFRTMLLETNPYLLAVTAVVSVLHSIFDFLAFKNDITFFRGKKSMEGLSVRSMVVNAGFQIVIWLYLADNETSRMILVSNGIGLLIELWKISRAIRVSFSGGKIQWTETEMYAKTTTKEYDEVATNHLMYVAMPLVSGYGVYSLLHQKHRGWYSWVLNALVGYIYMFGFVMMTPQLFINYKLKSVAHLNWRTMTYKSINTFIDDLFAFVIKMPIMHRLACLRDDVIFFVFLYQRWIYRTDYSRVNEFGQGGQELEGMKDLPAQSDGAARMLEKEGHPTEEEEAMSSEKEEQEDEGNCNGTPLAGPADGDSTISETPGESVSSIRQRRGAREKRT